MSTVYCTSTAGHQSVSGASVSELSASADGCCAVEMLKPVFSSSTDQRCATAADWSHCQLDQTPPGVASPLLPEAITVVELVAAMSLPPGSGRPAAESRLTIVVIDCRTFVSYNANHIAGAFNVACTDRFSRKRLLEGRASVADLISRGPEVDAAIAKQTYRQLVDNAAINRASVLFVAYDDNTSTISALPAAHPLRVLTQTLCNSKLPTKYLQGGLQEFHGVYSELCSKPGEPPARSFLYSPTTPLVDDQVDSAVLSHILPYLCIGNERDAACRQTLRDADVTHVVNVTSHLPLHFIDDVTMTYKRIPASDSGSQNLKQFFTDVIAFIETVRVSGGRVMVHCQGGVSRSPTLVIAYIMARYSVSMLDAFAFVKSRRPIVAPNFNFMGQLLDLELRCQSGELQSVLSNDVAATELPSCGTSSVMTQLSQFSC